MIFSQAHSERRTQHEPVQPEPIDSGPVGPDKGQQIAPGQDLARSHARAKAYLKHRPGSRVKTDESDPLWLKDDGNPLGEWGMQSIFRRLKARANMPELHAHLLRHNFAKKAARMGAGRGELQDMMDHRNPKMTLRYLGDVAKEIAARNTARYSPIQ